MLFGYLWLRDKLGSNACQIFFIHIASLGSFIIFSSPVAFSVLFPVSYSSLSNVTRCICHAKQHIQKLSIETSPVSCDDMEHLHHTCNTARMSHQHRRIHHPQLHVAIVHHRMPRARRYRHRVPHTHHLLPPAIKTEPHLTGQHVEHFAQ